MTKPSFSNENIVLHSSQSEALSRLQIPAGKSITCHMTHVAHIDLSWYWRFIDSIEMILETVRWNVGLVLDHPDARYSQSQMLCVRLVEILDPPLFERLRELVQMGRIELDSGQVVEPDHNIPSGESLVRQLLYGQGYARAKFGKTARVVLNQDSFGHCRNLPQIMKKAGIEAFLFKRPRQKFVKLPETPFYWQGLDGTQILSLRFINKGAGLPSLSQGYDLPAGTNELQLKIDWNVAQGVRHLFGTHCQADSGGVSPYVAPQNGCNWQLRYSLPSEFVDAIVSETVELPVVNSGLNFLYQGCYTTHIAEKEMCRRAERELFSCEFLGVVGVLHDIPYPGDELRECWWRLCYLQFHDIVTGTGSPESHEDSRANYQEVFLKLKLLRRRLELQMNYRLAIRDALRTIVIWHASPVNEDELVAVDIELPLDRFGASGDLLPSAGILVDDDDNRIPYQIVDKRVYQRYVRGTMLFEARNLPACGWKRFWIESERHEHNKVQKESQDLRVCGNILENRYYRVEVGGENSIINSIFDKTLEKDILRDVAEPIRLEMWPETNYSGDYGSEMQAWCLGVTEDREIPQRVGEVEVVESGPVRATLKTIYTWGHSAFIVYTSIFAHTPGIGLRFDMDWDEKEVLARLCIEPDIGIDAAANYEVQFGADRAWGDELEVPVQNWADISNAQWGLALLNRDRPGHTFRDNSIRMSLVRSATGEWDPCTDSGTITADVQILPHRGDCFTADIPGAARRFAYPSFGCQMEPSYGSSNNGSLFQIEPCGLVLSACKLSEDGLGIVLRVFESTGQATRGTILLNERFREYECYDANLLEDLQCEIDMKNDTIELELQPFEIRTIVLRSAAKLVSET